MINKNSRSKSSSSFVGLILLGTTVGLLSSCTNFSSSTETSSSSCTLTNNTTATSTVNTYGCYKVTRDTSSCMGTRQALGLSGFWLSFSCRVSLSVSGSNVVISTDGLPDHKSNYFEESDPCYEDFSAAGRSKNPNTIGEQSIVMTVPMSPTASGGSSMNMGVVGIATNGVAIFSNEAAPPDSIYNEVATFDKCEGHPAGTKYHYHIEPPSISSNDDSFVGVMRDGFPIYGRQDSGSATPTLDAEGGHTGATPDGSGSMYHYHIHLQTSGPNSAYFYTSGTYKGAAGSCSGCN